MRWFLSGKAGSSSLMLDRLNALSDGVTAIVLTLLVLGIDVPKDHDFSRDGLVSYLIKIEYQVTVYAVSFVLIGTYWIVRNAMFHYFRYGTRALTWLNLLVIVYRPPTDLVRILGLELRWSASWMQIADNQLRKSNVFVRRTPN